MYKHRTRRALAVLTLAGMAFGLLGAAQADTDSTTAPGTITSVAGATVDFKKAGFSGDGGPATDAQLHHPRAIAFDTAGNAYIADTLNQRIRKIDTEGIITTVVGNGTAAFAGDGGPALEASINQPHGVAVDAEGNLYVADSANHRIRMVDTEGVITTVAGNGTPGAAGDEGPAKDAQVKDPKTLAMDESLSKLFIADMGNNRIRRIDLGTGVISTMAGVTRSGSEGDGGPANRAQLDSPRGLAVAADGTIYIADSDNHRIRKIGTDGIMAPVAGKGTAGFSGDGGPAAEAELNDPRVVAVDSAGNLYVGEELGQRIRKIDSSGTISTIAGNGTAGDTGDGGPAADAQVDHVRAVTLDSAGNLWLADTFNSRVRMISGVATVTPPTIDPSDPGTPPTTNPPDGTSPGGESDPARSGYWALGSDGKVFAFGDAEPLGDVTEQLGPDAKAVRIEPTPSYDGYWIIDNRGGVFAFGDATFFGSVSDDQLKRGEKVASLSATPSGQGYWLFTNRGRVFPFGDAMTFGDMTGVDLNGPVLGSVATPSGRGYYMVASDGGVFSFGDADFHGSMGDTKLNSPVESLVPSADGLGYWLVAGDGGIFAFGTAPFHGSMGSTPLSKPVVGMVRYGSGYLMVAADGGIFVFSDRPFAGSLGDNPPEKPIVSVATLDVS